MTAILALLSTGLGKAILAALAGFVAIGAAYLKGQSAGKKAQKAKEADAYAQHLQEIADAANARSRVDTGRLPDDDRYRRD